MTRPLQIATPLALTLLAIGLAFGPLLVGVEPVGGDPERLYRPVKTELARALHQGRLPWWSDRFGVGVPLVAESHAAAFYPPNWPLYALLPVHAAYRLAMWGHHVLMAAGVFVYARRLGITPGGAALAAVSFPLCGFQAIHASHEVFYHALAWLPWALVFADRHAAGGRLSDLAALALVLGLQWTVGHFQMQTWTAILVLLTGAWSARGSGRWAWRSLGLLGGVVWGAIIAAVQLGPSWELARFVGQANRSLAERMFYWFPPAHLGEPVTPTLFRLIDPMDPYWFARGASGYEACLYVGSIPLVLAVVGLLARGRRRDPAAGRTALGLWKLLVPLSLAIATMPAWWPRGYAAILSIPVLGAYRAPARYTAVASLGLALLAGAGLDRLVSRQRFTLGLLGAAACGIAALAWSGRSLPLSAGPRSGIPAEFGLLAAHWLLAAGGFALAMALVLLWRRGRLPAGVLVTATLIELTALYYSGPIEWGWPLGLPRRSTVLAHLAGDPAARRVVGLENYPVLAGKATATPYLGFKVPDPQDDVNDLIAARPPVGGSMESLGRYGITHWAWARRDARNRPAGLPAEWSGTDPLLSRLLGRKPDEVWEIGRIPGAAGAARLAVDAVVWTGSDRLGRHPRLAPEEVAVAPEVAPGLLPPPRAGSTRLVRWDGRSGEVAHDGSCLLVLTRTFYPGWTYRLDGGPPRSVIPLDGGLQGVPIPGAGTTRVAVAYHPSGLRAAAALSLTGLGAVAAAWAFAGFRSHRAAEERPV